MATRAADMSMIANIRYELADGVTVDAKRAEAFQFDSIDQADVDRLAKAFGVTGAIRREGEGWTNNASSAEVAPAGKSLYVSQAGGTFSISDNYPASTSASCAMPEVDPAPDKPVASDEAPADQPLCETTPTVPPRQPLGAEEAKKVAKQALDAAGVDLHDPKVTVESFDGPIQTVRFQATVNGQAVQGFDSYVAVDPDKKIVNASGYLAGFDSVGSYELATLARAVERLNASYGGATTLEARDTVGGDAAGDPMVDESGGASPEPTVVKLTKAAVGLMMQNSYDGKELWLVPAFVFTTADNNEVLAQAADDKYIEEAPAQSVPEPALTDPGTGSGGGSSGNAGQAVDPVTPSMGNNCVPIQSAGDANNQPIVGEVCASTLTAKVGDTVQFSITASDGDRAFTEGCGDGVSATYGDGADGDVRCLACSTSVADGPGKVSRGRAHKYEKAGTHTATFTITSGAECGDKNAHDSTGTASLTIRVQ